MKKIFAFCLMMFCAVSLALAQQDGTSAATATTGTDSLFTLPGTMGKLAARLQLPALEDGEKCHLVILCHGFTGDMNGRLFDILAGGLLKCGIGVLRFDFNGHGKSEGKFEEMTVPNEIGDALAVIACARNLPRTKDISLLGHSQGGVVAAMVAGQLNYPQIRSVVLMAPAAVLKDDALRGSTMGASYDPWHAPEYVQLPSGHKLGRNYIQTALSLPIYETAAIYSGPVEIIHGMADRVVPYTYGQRFAEKMPGAIIQLLPAEDHSFTQNTAYAAALAVEWLSLELGDL